MKSAVAMGTAVSVVVVGSVFSGILATATCAHGSQRAVQKTVDQKTVDQLNVEIPMRDGKKLAADILLPAAEGKFPTVFIFTPYNRQWGGGPLPDELMAHELQDRQHYAYVVVDWRGRFGSTEAAQGVKRVNNGEDGYDVVEWIAKQPWSDGKVGMWGVSAVGSVQYDVALEKPPHLVCIVPASANIGLSYDQFYHGGVLERHYFGVFQAVGHGAAKLIEDHPTPDETWEEIDARFDRSAIDIPALFITGWYDTHPGLKIQTFQQIRTEGKRHYRDMKLLIGPWLHTRLGGREQGVLEYRAAEGVSDREAVRFFDYYLRGQKDNGLDKEPTIRYFQMGEDAWKGTEAWPPPTETVRYHLDKGGTLTRKRPDDARPDSFVYDPAKVTPTVGGNLIEVPKAKLQIAVGPQDLRDVESRSDVLVYTSEVLQQDVAVTGSVRAELYVSSDQKDTDFAVRLTDVYPNGKSILVTDGIHRMRYRDSLKKSELMDPGEVYSVTVTLPETATTFQKGHRIRIVVGSANWPRFQANPNTDRPRLIGPKVRVARNQVFHDPDHPSALLLPVNDSRKGSGR